MTYKRCFTQSANKYCKETYPQHNKVLSKCLLFYTFRCKPKLYFDKRQKSFSNALTNVRKNKSA